MSTDGHKRLTLPVSIGAQGPYPFLIDTGSQRTLLSTELAHSLALTETEAVRIISLSGPSTLTTVTVPLLRYGKQEIRDLRTPLVGADDLGSAGLLGLDGLKGRQLVLDFRAQQMEVRDSSARDSAIEKTDDTIVVRARSRFGQLILVDCRAADQRVSVILDTGAYLSIGNMALFRRLRADRLASEPRPIELISVTGETIPAQVALVKKLTIAHITVTDVPVIFTDAAPFSELHLSGKPAMFLGTQILQLFSRIAIDFGRQRIDFQLPSGPKE
jgi:predicted aspartyl protease